MNIKELTIKTSNNSNNVRIFILKFLSIKKFLSVSVPEQNVPALVSTFGILSTTTHIEVSAIQIQVNRFSQLNSRSTVNRASSLHAIQVL